MAISLTTRTAKGSELTTAEVDTNWTSIQSAVNSNETNIATNASDITALQSQDSTHTTNIATNTSDIATLDAAVVKKTASQTISGNNTLSGTNTITGEMRINGGTSGNIVTLGANGKLQDSGSSSSVADGSITQAKLSTSTVTLAGTITTGSAADISLMSYALFPMIHLTGGGANNIPCLVGHTTDATDPDSPRFGIENFQNTEGAKSPSYASATYDVDYRRIDA